MDLYVNLFLVFFALFSLSAFIFGFRQTHYKSNAFGSTGIYNFIGAFVWGDAVVLGVFWLLITLTTFLLQDILLFLLAHSLFWVIRSLGEVVYWLNQQFSTIKRNPPENYWFYKYFKSDAVWFIYQLYWQCICTLSTLLSIFFAASWVKTL